MTWEPVIGLEIHVQLKTRTKMFCRCPVGFGAAENTQTCPVCLGFPGALPVPNRTAIEWVVKLGLALGCEIAPRAVFARKNYFYPDLPKGYQISQYDLPSCINGKVIVPLPDGEHEVGIVRAHLEEDAAKNVHVGGRTGRIGGADYTLVDYNRGGTPLVEIVTAPDIHSAEEAKRFLQLLRQTIVELGISDAEMEKGTLRVDANVSVRPAGVRRAPHALRDQEHELVHAHRARDRRGDRPADRRSGSRAPRWSSTRTTSTSRPGRSPPRRTKEEADDYRYFPEPDLVPVEPSAELVERLRVGAAGAARGSGSGGSATSLDHERALVLVTGGLDPLWEATVAAGADPVAREQRDREPARRRGRRPGVVDAAELARLVDARERIPRKAFDEAIARVGEPGFSAEPYLAQEAVSDTAVARADRRRDPRREPGAGRAVPRRQGRPAGVLRRPGDEGDEGPGRRARRQRARARRSSTA